MSDSLIQETGENNTQSMEDQANGRPTNNNSEPSDLQNYEVGQRVQSVEKGPKKIGTIKYLGSVQGYQGIWAGVDWDDGEGRHNGTVNGIRYFDAAGEKSASFVRLHSLSRGITFLEALLRRYIGGNATSQEEQDEMYVLSSSQKRVAIELVGLNKVQEKQTHLDNLFHASLEYAGVSSPGSVQEISGLLPKLEELDLRGNLLPDLQAVGVICEQILSLRVLDLSDSRMKIGSDLLPTFSNLRTLVLNNCGITWEQVEKLKKSLPNIEELHLGGNKLRTIEPLAETLSVASVSSPCRFVQGFDFLRLLSLEGNEIESWDEIVKLSQLIRLEQLHLSKNRLKHIFYPECSALDSPLKGKETWDVGHKPFTNLRCLLLGGNKIQDWASVDALNNFPSLTEVRLSENPISDPTKGGASRYILVARLSKITILNGSEVKQRERKDSEIRYVRLVMSTLQGKSEEDILQQHPRFAELKALHEVPDEKLQVGVTGPQKMAAGLLSITLTCVGASAGEKAPVTKKLPATTTVGKLKMLCEGFFKLKVIKQRLFLKEEDTPMPTPLNDDMETLADIGVGPNGGTILVDEIEK